jgi:hypothetical protein
MMPFIKRGIASRENEGARRELIVSESLAEEKADTIDKNER